jgi:tRNA threonylcarbamoyl adenosine modification protein YeaZ
MTVSGLALHTTTGELGVALVDTQGNRRSQSWDLGRQLANEIQIKLAEFIQPLSWQDLGFIAVANGPGSYTSTRIGVVTAKTLAQQLQIPVYGVSTLMTIAWHYHQNLTEGQLIAVEMKAHNEDIFGSMYQFLGIEQELKTITPERRFTKKQWQKILEQEEKSSQSFLKIEAPNKIGFTTLSLLEIALIKNKIGGHANNNHWEYLTAFYE